MKSAAQFIFSALMIASVARVGFAAEALPDADIDFFERHIRPLFIERCYECHGAEKQKGGLRLDSRDAVLKGGDLGPALVPGKPEESLIIKAVSYDDPDFQMPPKNPLQKSEVARLREWIMRGAPDPRVATASPVPKIEEADSRTPKHWAYRSPAAETAPGVKNTEWARTEIDRFILAKIEAAELHPAADADPETLIRRLYFDLVGLPPDPARIDEFVADPSSGAYARLVDDLLASPHFGERWGRHWLDVARFAESVTLRGLVFTEAWRYRDYVIEAFNRDLPLNRFIEEQIAGDLMSYANLDDMHRARAATTYLVLGNFNYEEQDKDQLRMDIVDEQLDTIGKGLLGQTISCARCHDHKFDPIPTRDYYAMAGILRNTQSAEHANVSTWLNIPLPLSPEEEEKVSAHERRIAELERKIRKTIEQIAESGKAGGRSISDLPGLVLDDSEAERVGDWQASEFNKPFVGTGYVHDSNAGKGSKTVTFHPRLQNAGTYEVRLAYTHGDNRATKTPVTILHAGGETTVHVNQRVAPPLDGHFISLGRFQFEKGNQGYVLVSNADTDGHVIVDAVQFLPAELANAVAGTARTEPNAHLQSELKQLRAELKRVTETGPARPMVMSVKEEKTIGDTYIHIRGSVHNVGPTVPRGFLSIACDGAPPEFSSGESGRRELASWIANDRNPLTARVFVNRAWLWLFGEGIVRTPDNFGTRGELPSHPELLDYLAVRFVENGWSVKSLVRELVLSRTYQLSSAPDHHLESVDPANRLFARANRRRLDAEALRDSILHLSGQLKLAMGGPTIPPSVKADYGYVNADTRRSVYVPAFRNALPQLFELFDFADTSVVTGQRNSSIVAPQALYLLNHPFILEHSRLLAERLLAISTFEDRIAWLYQSAFARRPAPREVEIAREHARLARSAGISEVEALAELCQAVFASIDFRYLN